MFDFLFIFSAFASLCFIVFIYRSYSVHSAERYTDLYAVAIKADICFSLRYVGHFIGKQVES